MELALVSLFSKFTSLYSRKTALNCSQPPKNPNINTHTAERHDALTPAYANTQTYKAVCAAF